MKSASDWKRIAVHRADDKIVFFDPDEVFYLEASHHDTIVRTARKTPYRSNHRLRQFAAALPSPPRSSAATEATSSIWPASALSNDAGKSDYRLRLDPPVNKLIPLSRGRLAAFRKLMGVP